jgi:hypothetical protein
MANEPVSPDVPIQGLPDASPQLRTAFEEMHRLTARLRSFGMYLVAIAAVALIGLVVSVCYSAVNRGQLSPDGDRPRQPLDIHLNLVFVFPLTFSGYGIVVLYMWDTIRRKGNIYYQEVSDEIEWAFQANTRRKTKAVQHAPQTSSNGHNPAERPGGASRSKPSRGEGERPDLSVRLMMRSFLEASRLPFAGDNTSGVLYLAYFLLCLAVSLIGFIRVIF